MRRSPKLSVSKDQAISALDQAHLCSEFHDNITTRCGTRNGVSAVGAIMRAAKWNFHISDAYQAVADYDCLIILEIGFLDAVLLTGDLETARLYSMFLAESELPEELTLNFLSEYP
jgi:uncharacterized Fe-S center protein